MFHLLRLQKCRLSNLGEVLEEKVVDSEWKVEHIFG